MSASSASCGIKEPPHSYSTLNQPSQASISVSESTIRMREEAKASSPSLSKLTHCLKSAKSLMILTQKMVHRTIKRMRQQTHLLTRSSMGKKN